MSGCEGCIYYKEKYSGIQMWTFGAPSEGYCKITGKWILKIEDTTNCPNRTLE